MDSHGIGFPAQHGNSHTGKPGRIPRARNIDELRSKGFEHITASRMHSQWQISNDPLADMARREAYDDRIHADYVIIMPGKRHQLWARVKP